MKRSWILVFSISALSLAIVTRPIPVAAFDQQDLDTCYGADTAPNSRTPNSILMQAKIEACKRLIDAGGLSRHDLARAYWSRGNAEADRGNGEKRDGRDHQAEEQYLAASVDYGDALIADPHFAAAFNNKGVVQVEWGLLLQSGHIGGLPSQIVSSYDEAIENYSEAIRLDPHNADYYCNRGNAYSFKGQNEQAERDRLEADSLNGAGDNPSPASLACDLKNVAMITEIH